MSRPHIEFIQTQNVDWQLTVDGTSIKLLNAAPGSTDSTLLVRYPPGYNTPSSIKDMPAEEYFVLEGSLFIGNRFCELHAYGFLPQNDRSPARSSEKGATVLIFRHAENDPNCLSDIADQIEIDTPKMQWDVSTYDPKLSHLRLARKVLRLGPNDSCRTFLLAGMPHGVPDDTKLPSETHDHCEEMFMIDGGMWTPEGLMHPGAYFFRPPHIVHGPHVSEFGFFQIMRSPGANKIVTHWSKDKRPLPIGTPYAPTLPIGSPKNWGRPYSMGSKF
ncbi:cupin domain-containing protein [Hirschia baltica]|uniref:ChrR-like cupin domain-containing protein n=1 Tax=Hirschia baltica (strain ATCC 49814 / DSM 5838 / IFAM 1418) TaxID=582402 RepID=C6XJB1_HIRBI|nr:hypothetical protein [Hirschia baltica]ACT59206.1 hypothetical protein Hbal_1517 [Hirschia baltica ATCC 49814]